MLAERVEVTVPTHILALSCITPTPSHLSHLSNLPSPSPRFLGYNKHYNNNKAEVVEEDIQIREQPLSYDYMTILCGSGRHAARATRRATLACRGTRRLQGMHAEMQEEGQRGERQCG